MLAKFARPIQPGLFPRERLFQLVDELREKPVLWASGPAGCGKTALFNSYLESRNLPCLWYQLDERNADPAAFFYGLSLAVQGFGMKQKNPLPLFSAEYLPGLRPFALRYFEEMFKGIKSPFILVFDNYQDVAADSGFHEVMRNGISRTPQGVNVILVSRGEPPEAFARMHAYNEIGVMGWSDLRMTLDESEGFIRQASGDSVPKNTAERLYRFTDGWAAGLVLLLNRIRKSKFDLTAVEPVPPEEIFDYFASEIFEKTDASTRNLLCKTAFLPQMTAWMAEELTGMAEADHVLSLLSRMNYFTEKRVTSCVSYQYHPLFRQFLLVQAEKSFDPAERKAIIQNAAGILEKDGQIHEAFALFSRLRDGPNMVRIILSQGFSMISQGRHQTLLDWLRELPEDETLRNAWLTYWLGVALAPFEPLRGQPYFERAFHMFCEQKDQSGALLAWSGVVDTLLYLTGSFGSLDQWIERLEELLQKDSSFPDPQTEARVSASMITALGLRQPDHSQFERWSQRCLSLVHHSEDRIVQLQTYLPLAFCRLFQGAFHDVDLLIKTFGLLARSGGTPPLPRIMQMNLEAYYCWVSGRFEEGLKAAKGGVELTESFGIPIFRFLLKGHSAAAFLSCGKIDEAEAMLSEMAEDLASARSWDKAYYHLLETWAALHRRDLSKAKFCAASSWEMASNAGEAQSLFYCALAQAIVALEMGQPKECAIYLERARSQRVFSSSTFARFNYHLTKTRLARDQDDETIAHEALEEAMALGRIHGYCNSYLWQPDVMAGLCATALEKGMESDYVKNLIRKRNFTPPPSAKSIEQWPWSVKVYTLGKFEIFLNDEALHFVGKVPKRPLDLLKVLIAYGGREVGEHQICDALWPDSEGDAAHSAFTSALSRLRKLLKIGGSIETHGGQVSLNDSISWVDIRALEQVLGEALELWEKGSAERAAVLTQTAFAANHGPFLPDDPDLSCTTPARERLRVKMLKCIKALGRYFESRGQWEDALSCYAEGLKNDPCAEDFYERRMICFQQLGQTHEALKEYEQCSTALSTFLDNRPSENVQSLFKTLKQNPPQQA